ncbi:PD-(D/E)XK nuclease family protein [Vibrio sp. SCSIO 43169]|uniref:PDDEXK-like family protein n=1 Tax=Vibrio sp. SCSIO 43169 TaxID=2822801 RepID=UPI002043B88B|nr:PD-(D/E)XK nuclease family protein [Vibrio sp. SCSIO 43169]MCM5510117.1 PD-(D/E)XK nuclease family protein [Vibrio sp. SCSIO 43169]
MNTELEKIERLFLSKDFSEITSYSTNFDLFKVMGVRSKEHVHSNILAALLQPTYPHGLQFSFLNSFIKGLAKLNLAHGKPLPLSALISATDNNVRVFRELENIDLVIEFPSSRLVIAIENKVWAKEQEKQIARYQETLYSRYPNQRVALVFLTTDGHQPETLDSNSSVPVYCMSYGEIANQLSLVQSQANVSARSFINQFISHIEGYMSGSSELKELCWQIYSKHEEAYKHMVEAHDYCIRRKIEESFSDIEARIQSDAAFSQYRSDLEIKTVYEENSKYLIACDIDVRLNSWPTGLWVKIYKHFWLGVFPYITSKDLESVKTLSMQLDCYPNQSVKSWEDKYYVSANRNLDKERMVLSDGNTLTCDDINIALNKLSTHIEEINCALKMT